MGGSWVSNEVARAIARLIASMAASAVSAPRPMILVMWPTSRPFCQATHEAMAIGSPSGEQGHDPWQKMSRAASRGTDSDSVGSQF